MGLLNFLAKKSIKSTAKVLLRSYTEIKERNPDLSEKELYTLTLSMRPSYKKQVGSSIIRFNGYDIDINKFNSIRDLINMVVRLEHAPQTMDIDLLFRFGDISEKAIEEVFEEIKK